MPDGEQSGGWKLEGFEAALDRWIDLDSPSPDLSLHVTAWFLTRIEDPYQGMQRQPGFANLWFGRVPDTEHDGRVVACSLWIEESARVVRCDLVSTLSLPI